MKYNILPGVINSNHGLCGCGEEGFSTKASPHTDTFIVFTLMPTTTMQAVGTHRYEIGQGGRSEICIVSAHKCIQECTSYFVWMHYTFLYILDIEEVNATLVWLARPSQ